MEHIENMDDLEYEPDPADEPDGMLEKIMRKHWFEYFFGLMVAQEHVREKNYDMARCKFQELDKLCDRAMRDPEKDDLIGNNWVDLQMLAQQMDAEMESSDPQSVNYLIDILFEMLVEYCHTDLAKLGFLGPYNWDEEEDEDWED